MSVLLGRDWSGRYLFLHAACLVILENVFALTVILSSLFIWKVTYRMSTCREESTVEVLALAVAISLVVILLLSQLFFVSGKVTH